MELRRKIILFHIVSYNVNYISKDPPTHGGVYFNHVEQFGVSFKTFEKILRNVPCFRDDGILGMHRSDVPKIDTK